MRRKSGFNAIFANIRVPPKRVSEFIKNHNMEPMISNVIFVTTRPGGMNTLRDT